jgi:hypothetical protein
MQKVRYRGESQPDLGPWSLELAARHVDELVQNLHADHAACFDRGRRRGKTRISWLRGVDQDVGIEKYIISHSPRADRNGTRQALPMPNLLSVQVRPHGDHPHQHGWSADRR